MEILKRIIRKLNEGDKSSRETLVIYLIIISFLALAILVVQLFENMTGK